MFTDQNIAFIGSGIMGEAMIRGLIVRNILPAGQIYAADPMPDRLADLHERYGIYVTGNNAEAAEAAQIIVLSTKPQNLAEVMPGIRGHLRRQDLLLSILAGTPIRKLSDGVAHAAVVRAMPNTPALVGEGASAICAGPTAVDADLDWAEGLLGAVGTVVRVPERSMDAVTGLSGSGPAYVFLVAEALIDAGVAAGLPRDVADRLTRQTLLGSARLLAESDDGPEALRAAVTSPGGTTAAGLRQLESHAVRAAVIDAVAAATARSAELG